MYRARLPWNGWRRKFFRGVIKESFYLDCLKSRMVKIYFWNISTISQPLQSKLLTLSLNTQKCVNEFDLSSIWCQFHTSMSLCRISSLYAHGLIPLLECILTFVLNFYRIKKYSFVAKENFQWQFVFTHTINYASWGMICEMTDISRDEFYVVQNFFFAKFPSLSK